MSGSPRSPHGGADVRHDRRAGEKGRDEVVKLTVLYNLPPGADIERFLQWRTTEHQENNAAMPGVIRTDFFRAHATQLGRPRYEFITEAYFASMQDLEAAFFTPDAQEKLQKDLEWTHEPVFLVSEEVTASHNLSQLGGAANR